MRWGCREHFPRHRLQRKLLVSNPSMHHGTCITHMPWCMSRSLTRGDGENVPDNPGACATRKFTYLARGPCVVWCCNKIQKCRNTVNTTLLQRAVLIPSLIPDIYWVSLNYFSRNGGNVVKGKNNQKVARYPIGNDTVLGKTVGMTFKGTVNNSIYLTEENYEVWYFF